MLGFTLSDATEAPNRFFTGWLAALVFRPLRQRDMLTVRKRTTAK